MGDAPAGFQLGIDVGGTFTDLVLRRPSGAEINLKLPSTPGDPAVAVLEGMDRVLSDAGISADRLAFWAHGTTTATNALLERKGARVGLLTTAGFGDLLEIGRQQRPALYDLFADKPPPLVPRHLRREVNERLSADGEVIRPLDEAEVRSVLRRLKAEGIEALAVCFLHAYLNPTHERLAAELARQECPEVYLCPSSQILPEFREYERLSTTVLNAYVGPGIEQYMSRLKEELAHRHLRCAPYVLQSNGRLMTFAAARQRPAHLLASGPSAGVTGAAALGRAARCERVLTLDMGGTSADVGVVVDGKPRLATIRELDGRPLKAPMVEVASIGAGGGSIGWIDSGGFLRVGPQSAGADPGPACYGRGGAEATVTDAHLVLGRLGPTGLLGGEMPLHQPDAEAALGELGAQLGWDLAQTAQSIIRLADAEMVRALRSVTVARGDDPRSFALFAYGGAGPLHAAELARSLGIRRVVIPPGPGNFCAWGALSTEIGMDFGRTCRLALEPTSADALSAAFAGIEAEARSWLESEGVALDRQVLDRVVECRYLGQDYELAIPLGERAVDPGVIGAAFHEAHEREYGYAIPERPVECVTIRVYAHERRAAPVLLAGAEREGAETREPPPVSARPVWCDGVGIVETRVYARNGLPVGWETVGPAVIEQADSTTLVPPGVRVMVDPWHNLEMELS